MVHLAMLANSAVATACMILHHKKRHTWNHRLLVLLNLNILVATTFTWIEIFVWH